MMRTRSLSTLLRPLTRVKPAPRGLLLWYGTYPRLASLPSAQLRRLHPSAIRVFDNTKVHLQAQAWSALGLGTLGLLVAFIMLVSSGQTVAALSPQVVVTIASFALIGALAGGGVGRQFVAPRFAQPPIYMVRYTAGPAAFDPRAVTALEPLDLASDWVAYFRNVLEALHKKDEQRAQRMEGEMAAATAGAEHAGMGIFDARTEAGVELMQDERADWTSELPGASKLVLAGIAGIIAVAFIGLIAFTIIIGQERAKITGTAPAPAAGERVHTW